MRTAYVLSCMRQKLLHKKRSLTLVLVGMLIAALGILVVASSARNRELQTPWYAQRSAKITFEEPVSPKEVYSALHAEYTQGRLNGYALIASVDTSGGICLGGQEGALWYPVNSDDQGISTQESVFWIHRQAVPERFFHNLEALTASIDGHSLKCAGLTDYGLNWNWSDEPPTHPVSFLLDGKPAHVESPILENVYIGNDWLYIAPVLVGAGWLAQNDISISGVCITLTNPNDMETLHQITSQISLPLSLTTNWNAGRLGPLTANEWLYLGMLILAVVNVASLYYGLIDGYRAELFIFRKLGAAKGSIRKAMLLFIASMSIGAFAGAWFVYALLLKLQGERQWLAALPTGYIAVLFFAYVGICLLLALHHTNRLLKSYRKKGAYL